MVSQSLAPCEYFSRSSLPLACCRQLEVCRGVCTAPPIPSPLSPFSDLVLIPNNICTLKPLVVIQTHRKLRPYVVDRSSTMSITSYIAPLSTFRRSACVSFNIPCLYSETCCRPYLQLWHPFWWHRPALRACYSTGTIWEE